MVFFPNGKALGLEILWLHHSFGIHSEDFSPLKATPELKASRGIALARDRYKIPIISFEQWKETEANLLVWD